jgi:hypothetical protein
VNRALRTWEDDTLAWERWINEGGRVPPEAFLERDHAVPTTAVTVPAVQSGEPMRDARETVCAREVSGGHHD